MFIIDDDFIDKDLVDGFYHNIVSDNEGSWHSTGMIHGDRKIEPEHKNIFNIKDWDYSKDFQFVRVLDDLTKPGFDYGIIDEQAKRIFLSFCRKHSVQVSQVLRAKVNFTWPSEDDRIAPHIDATYPHKVFLYYLNDGEGDTIFYDKSYPLSEEGEEIFESIVVKPKAGRGMVFDGLRFHTAKSPSKGNRFSLNIVFLDTPQ